MTANPDAERLAVSLRERLGSLSFVDRMADEVTELVIEAVVGWGRDEGWRVYRRARSVVPLPYGGGHSVVDVGIARAPGAPIVVEVDRSDRRRTLEKLAAEAGAGRVALWVRWGTGPFTEPAQMPQSVLLVPFAVRARRGEHGHRLFSTVVEDPPPPEHSDMDLSSAEQADLF